MNSHLTQEPTQLLISFANAGELEVARGISIDIFDLKNPAAGPLGLPPLREAQAFLRRVPRLESNSDAARATPLTSIALGELVDLNSDVLDAQEQFVEHWLETLRGFDYVKIGLSQVQGSPPEKDWAEKLINLQQQLGSSTQLVPVIYADHDRVRAPNPEEVFQFARQSNRVWSQLRLQAGSTTWADSSPRRSRSSPGEIGQATRPAAAISTKFAILVDTFGKPSDHAELDSPQHSIGLFHYFPDDQLTRYADFCRREKFDFFTAGSIQLGQLPRLLRCGIQAIGVRGAVCCNTARTASLDRSLLSEFSLAVKQISPE